MTSKERAQLRAQANTLDPIIQIGKEGMSDNLITQVDDTLDVRELIKISVLQNCGDDPKELGIMISERTRSQLVQVIGKKIVIYKEAKNEKNRKIVLPKATKKQD